MGWRNSFTRDCTERKKSNLIKLEDDQGVASGVIVAGSNGVPLVGARISLRDNSSSRIFETVSDGSGSYSLAVRIDEYDLSVISTGFEKEKIENIRIASGEIVQKDLILANSDAATVATLTVQLVAVQSGSQALLAERQNSFDVVDAIGADQFKSSGASSAADAMKSVTGVTIVDRKMH